VGIEMAEAFHHRGLATTIVAADDNLLGASLDRGFGDRLGDAVRALGIAVHLGQRIECIRGRDGRATDVGCDGGAYPADVVLVAVGTAPNVDLARAAGLRIGESGGVWVDDRQRTSAPGVWAGGDCAEAMHRLTGRPVNIHLGTIANRQGRIAGLDIGGGGIEDSERFPGVLGTAITRVLDIEISRTGLTEAQALEAGIEGVAAEFESETAAGYWPHARPMRVRAVADRATRRLMGAQIFGGEGAAKRIDALAMAIWNEMTVDEMVNVDLSYAPPFSGVWDPVLVAARKLASALGGAPD
ncbi:MAG: FAD-dependent oxidoreductase, partial [Dehalococcoidia bacterium]